MPISPSLRRSPAKEIAHKRGRSFGSTLPAKSKDDGLLLFNDLQKSERENFLLEQSDDFGASLSKLNYFPNFKLGFNIVGRVQSHDLLNVDGDKNDYDWLLTPPETPLFPSLDDEEDQRAGLAHRGRAQTKPLSISRSSTMENTQRSRRSSASPNRLSPSPRSRCSAAFTRTRSSNSSSRYSPPLALQPSVTSRRSSTPPPAAKTLTPPRRSPSPSSRRVIIPSGPTLNGTRGASPVKDNRMSSLPKLHEWQSNDLGFSFDAPPNLRTSLPDRPVSRSRGGSPSSFSGLDIGSRGSRRSISPTPSRRASSSGSNERDRFGSYGKASATSSGDDDLDCVQSVPVGYDGSPAVKKSLSVMKTKTLASSKKLSKSFSSNSAPKRTFDSAVWLMDHRKAPQDMFRPLLSSVSTTTFGAGKGSNVHRPVLSRSSSITTSSNASSDHRATFGSCMDDDQERHNLASDCEATACSGIHEHIFMFDKLDELNEGPSCQQRSLSPTQSGPEEPSCIENYVKNSKWVLDMESSRTANQRSSDLASSSESGHDKMATCTRCRKLFNVIDVDGCDYCEECTLRVGVFPANPEIHTTEESHQHHKPCIPSEACLAVPVCVEDSNQASIDQRPVINEPPSDYSPRCPTQLTVDTAEEVLLGQHMKDLTEKKRSHAIGDSSLRNSNDISSSSHGVNTGGCQVLKSISVEYDNFRDQNGSPNHGMPQCSSELSRQGNEFVSDIRISDSHKLTLSPSHTVNTIKGKGISVLLLQKSSSNTWPVVEGRPLAATSILCSEPYYTRDSDNTMRHSIQCDSLSVASSLDVGSSRQYDVRFEHLKTSKHCDFDGSQIGSTVSHQSIASVSDMSISGSSVSFCPQHYLNDACYPINNSENNASRTMISAGEYGTRKDALSSAIECWTVAQAIVNDDSEAVRDVVIQNQSADRMAHDDDLCANMSLDADGNCIKMIEENVSVITNYAVDTPEHPHPCGENCCYSHQMQSEVALVSDEAYSHQMQSEVVLVSDEANRLDDCFVSAISEEDVLVSATEAKIADLPNDEGSGKQIQRSFTFEEATDTILFCSSIVHDLAYKAATIALEDEQGSELAAAPRPTIRGTSKSFQREEGLSKLPHRRTPKRNIVRKRLDRDTITETAEMQVITKDPVTVYSASEITRPTDSIKPPKMESKCNCTVM